MADKSKIITGQIDKIAFGGDGILRNHGQVVFVPFTAVGDMVRARMVANKRTFARAELQESITEGPSRQIPACTYFGRCGGCQFQHINYENQASLKQDFVSDALARIGALTNVAVRPIIKAEHRWFYRRHIRLHLKPRDLGFSVGFIGHDQQTVVEINQCMIFGAAESTIIKDIKEICATIKPAHQKATIEVALYKTSADKYVVSFDFAHEHATVSEVFIAALSKYSCIQGIMWRIGDLYYRIGDCDLFFLLDGLKINYNPLVFVQAHAEQSAKLYMELRRLVKDINAQKVLDLYCGIGATSLMLARDGVSVLAVEGNPHAINLARENAASNSLNDIDWRVSNVDDIINDTLIIFCPDVVIANPPRTGLSHRVTEALIKMRPAHIAYISCMPATLARDLKMLCHEGYRITYCQPFDLFPQTTHVETLVWLTL